MAYVPVPKDLSKIKTKLAFNLTKRQLICFSGAVCFLLKTVVAIPLKKPINQKNNVFLRGICFSGAFSCFSACFSLK